ncbi:glycosyltransferase [Cytophagales bacterium LB-30]|uniref:Glycosyltransferase n=1 Tax=Shiella aurantiaca TaxID=3058365 RepID=A0ABT8F327_9BACT|nr:glycosyltransferase [Shiella aurantiaca]MDN4164862.1 glycosyltransferase [Shiella aurantiaca]
MTAPKLTLIISFYNKIEWLLLILKALEKQSFREFEVIVADDGSKPEVVEALKAYIRQSPLEISHIWQEDVGFRKVIILNEALRQSRSEYLVFIDGDCVPHPHFIKEHYQNREKKVMLAGRRVDLSEKMTRKITQESISQNYLVKRIYLDLLWDGIFGATRHVIKSFYMRPGRLRKYLNRKDTGLLGCNFSLFKEDLEAINGFDERYLAPAVGEDTDIEYRLRWNGVRLKTVKNMAIQYHLYHAKLKRQSANLSIFEEVKKSKTIVTPFGLKKLAFD